VVVFLGTSLTAGLGLVRTEDTYVARVAELADAAGLPIRTVNAGVSGATSADGLSRIGWVLKDPLDVLVLELGANDGLRGQDPRATEENLLAIIDSTRARYPHARIVLAGMEAPPNLGATYTDAFRAVFPRVARERHTALIPFLLQGVGGVRALNQADGIHPNAKGERIVARNVWNVLEPIVRDLEAHRTASEGR
jgi:acyl-CoA thioesterase-1